MTKTVALLLVSCLFPYAASSQTNYPTRDSTYFFWQPDTRIVYNDYRWPLASSDVHAEVALWTVMDLPQNTDMLRPNQIRTYIAPVCDRRMSRASANDTLEIAFDNILFDILELSAREARVKISRLPDSVMSVEQISNRFKAIVKEMHENRLRTIRRFVGEIQSQKKEKVTQKWQQKLKQDLNNTEKWSTQPVECYRFLKNQPIEPGYFEDLNSNAKFLGNLEQVLGRDVWHAEFCQISRQKK